MDKEFQELMQILTFNAVTGTDHRMTGRAAFVLGGAMTAMRKLLHHSWRDVFFQYDGLTPDEKRCITREQHAVIAKWVESCPE